MASKEKKGLGTGLGALFADAELLQEESELQLVPIERIEPRSDQPRKDFDEESLSLLADSIAEFGLIQPITVRRLESGFYQIIAGERRWRASRMAGLSEVPVRVLEADDKKTAQLALIENLQREDLNPIEEAEGYKKLIEEFSLTQDETARSVGKSRPAVANALRLLALSPAVRKLVSDGTLSAGHARALLALESASGQEAAAALVVKKGLSVRKTEQLVASLLKQPEPVPAAEPEKPFVDYAAEVSRELTDALGRKASLKEGRRGGRIELTYYDADDREALIRLLYTLKQK